MGRAGKRLSTLCLVAITLCSVLLSSAYARNVAIQSSEQLLQQCRSYVDVINNRHTNDDQIQIAFMCASSIIALNTLLNQLSQYGWLNVQGTQLKVCSPHIGVEQAVLMFVRYMEKNPQLLSSLSGISYMSMLMESYMCNTHPWE